MSLFHGKSFIMFFLLCCGSSITLNILEGNYFLVALHYACLHRLISSFNDGLHDEGLPIGEREKIKAQFLNYPPDISTRSNQMKLACIHNFNLWGSYRANKGCYVKMLNGYKCHYNISITPTMIARASSYLKKFLFVGIFEDYEATVKAFLKFTNRNWGLIHLPLNRREDMSTTRAPELGPFAVELEKFRSDQSPCRDHLKEARDLGLLVYTDPYDTDIYQLAQTLWEAIKREYSS